MATTRRTARKTPTRAARAVRAPKAEVPAAKSSAVECKWHFIGFGLAFGYFLTKAGVTDYNRIIDMFTGHDWKLLGAVLLAVAVSAVGIFLLQRNGSPTLQGGIIEWRPSEFRKDRLIGAALFGVGWAMAGACPATALAQVGEGKLMALFTVAGILLGAWAYGYWTGGSDDSNC